MKLTVGYPDPESFSDLIVQHTSNHNLTTHLVYPARDVFLYMLSVMYDTEITDAGVREIGQSMCAL